MRPDLLKQLRLRHQVARALEFEVLDHVDRARHLSSSAGVPNFSEAELQHGNSTAVNATRGAEPRSEAVREISQRSRMAADGDGQVGRAGDPAVISGVIRP